MKGKSNKIISLEMEDDQVQPVCRGSEVHTSMGLIGANAQLNIQHPIKALRYS